MHVNLRMRLAVLVCLAHAVQNTVVPLSGSSLYSFPYLYWACNWKERQIVVKTSNSIIYNSQKE